MAQESLDFSVPVVDPQRESWTTTPRFNGPEYAPERDQERLTAQQERIKALMADGQWRTLRAIAEATQDPEASVSAQLRHLRKARFGSWTVERRHVARGLFEYRVTR